MRRLEALGVEVRMVPHRDWVVHERDLIAAMDARTRVLAISHVSFYTGQCHDLERLSDGTRQTGALFAVDATHSSGVLRVPVGLTDLTVSSSYKWMLATHGVAPCYLSSKAEAATQATCFGWHNLAVWPEQTAERHPKVAERSMPELMEPGNPAMLVVMHLDRALEVLLGLGVDKIQEHARDLSEVVSQGLEKLGLTVISPGTREARSGNTCFLCEDAEGMQRRLEERGILAWGEFGRIRVSTHVHNHAGDLDRLMAALRDI